MFEHDRFGINGIGRNPPEEFGSSFCRGEHMRRVPRIDTLVDMKENKCLREALISNTAALQQAINDVLYGDKYLSDMACAVLVRLIHCDGYSGLLTDIRLPLRRMRTETSYQCFLRALIDNRDCTHQIGCILERASDDVDLLSALELCRLHLQPDLELRRAIQPLTCHGSAGIQYAAISLLDKWR